MLGQAAQIRKAGLKAHHKHGVNRRGVSAHDFGGCGAVKGRHFGQIGAEFAAIAHRNIHMPALVGVGFNVRPQIFQAV